MALLDNPHATVEGVLLDPPRNIALCDNEVVDYLRDINTSALRNFFNKRKRVGLQIDRDARLYVRIKEFSALSVREIVLGLYVRAAGRLRPALVTDIRRSIGDFYANDFTGFIKFRRYVRRQFNAPGFITFANEYVENILVTDACASNERSE